MQLPTALGCVAPLLLAMTPAARSYGVVDEALASLRIGPLAEAEV